MPANLERFLCELVKTWPDYRLEQERTTRILLRASGTCETWTRLLGGHNDRGRGVTYWVSRGLERKRCEGAESVLQVKAFYDTDATVFSIFYSLTRRLLLTIRL